MCIHCDSLLVYNGRVHAILGLKNSLHIQIGGLVFANLIDEAYVVRRRQDGG